METFRNLKELIRWLGRGQALLADMFSKRKTMAIRYDDAVEVLDGNEGYLQFLINHGVIIQNADSLELDDTYQKFFENVLAINEDINVASVEQYVNSLKLNIESWLTTDSDKRKAQFMREVRHTFRNIDIVTRKNVIDLKRNIDNTYKNEPTFAIKKKKLVHLDEKRHDIAVLINECERVIDEKQTTFFIVAMDVQLKEIVTDVKLQLREVYHNLLELDRQIINYLNLIEYQNRLFQKVQKLKYLHDQMLLDTNTDIRAKLSARNPVWMEPRPRYPLKVSLSMLRNTEEGLKIVQDIAKGKGNSRLKKGNLAEPLTAEELTEQQQMLQMVDISEVKNAFMASGDHLFHFIMNYSNYRIPMDDEAKLVLFCQIATQYLDEMQISAEYRQFGNMEYPMIFSKQS